MSATEMVTSSDAISDLAAELADQEVIAVDMEADSLHHYHDKVCLVQFSTLERTVLVDPLAGGDMSPLARVLADAAVVKVFHAADYDIRCLHRDYGFVIRGLFDTMIASQFVGRERIGLADVLNYYFGVELDKKFQRADWSLRPLPVGMRAYAANDTRYLHQLYERLQDEVNTLGRGDWVKEEFAILEQVRHEPLSGPLFLRMKGAGTLPPRGLATLEALLQWRDRYAGSRDWPLFKVLGNKALLAIAAAQPRTRAALAQAEGLSEKQVARFGDALLACVEQALELPGNQLPAYPRTRRPERDPEQEKRVKRLKQWRTTCADALQMDAGVLINNSSLEAIATLNPDSYETLAAASILKQWQLQALAPEILQTLG